MNHKRYWVAFNAARGIGPARLQRLIDVYGDVSAAWQATDDDLRLAGIDNATRAALREAHRTLDLDALLAELDQLQVSVLTWDDPDYPQRLRDIPQSPPVLYLRGEFQPADDFAVAIVGTRGPTPYGREVAQRLAIGLASAGATVVSGLARGIDAIAHQGALKAGGRTIAVMANGLDRVYPPEHHQLANEVSANGVLLSDYPVGRKPDPGNFPARNRLISALARATVVVEAGERSGALITADFAVEQGRDVYAVPGSILSPKSAGSNRLLRDGAQPLLSVEALLEDLNMGLVNAQTSVRMAFSTDPTEQAMLRMLTGDPVHVDDIGVQTGMPIEQVTSLLALMELKGMVRQVAGMHYVVVREPGVTYHID